VARKDRQPGAVVGEALFVLFVLDREGGLVLSEGDAFTPLGTSSLEVVGQSAFEVYNDYPDLINGIRCALNGEAFAGLVENRDGTFDTHCHPLCDPGGSITGVVGVAFDIAGYRESEQRYRQLFEGITDICFVIDKGWHYTHANLATARVTTWEENQLIGQRLQDVLPDFGDTLPYRVYKQVLETGQPQRFTSRTLALPGSIEGVFDVMVYPIPDGIMCIAQDITERAKAEQALRESEARYHALFEELRDACFIVSLHGRFMSFNHAMLDLFGYSRQEFHRLHDKTLYVDPSDRLRYQEEIELMGSVQDFPTRMCTKHGAVMDCLITASLWRDAAGKLQGYQGIIRDITAQKRAEAEIQRSNTLLDALNRMQSEFIIESDPGPPFQKLLGTILDLTQSRGGFIAEMVEDAEKEGFLRVHATSNMPWLEAWTMPVKETGSADVAIDDPRNILGVIVRSGQPSISNNPSNDSRWKLIASEVSPPQSFLGLPFYSGIKLVGILGLADRQDGYNELMVFYLQPLLSTCASIIERYKSEQQRREAEKALRDSEERYRLLVESAPVPLFVHAGGKIVYANDACAGFFGAKRAGDLSEHPVSAFVHPDCQSAFEKHRRRKAKSALTQVQKINRLDGKVVDVEVVAIPVTYHDTPATQVIIHDVTERIRAEQAERAQRVLAEALNATAAAVNSTLELDQVLDQILSSAGQVVPHDASTIMLVEDGIARVVGHRGYAERGTADAAMAVRFSVTDVHTLRTMSRSHLPMIIPDVRRCSDWVDLAINAWVRSYAGAPIILNGETLGFINLESGQPGFYTSLHTERLQTFASQAAIAIRNARLYEAIRLHAAELEASNNELEAFSHTVAHDLKAPLHIVIGYASLLLSDYTDKLTSEVVGHVCQIETYAHKMNDMIENLLLLARLRDAATTVTRVQVQPVVQAAIERFRRYLDERGVTVSIEPDCPDVMGYGPWLEEVFANLIENAIKYCGPNNASPRITIRGKSLDNEHVRYEVEDNGLGVAPEHQERLFKMFTRFHAGYTRGAGLGLSIVNRIVNKLGGEVGVESELNKGSTFWFTLPAPSD
jgi:PAS domain S-box-containing protein